MEIGVVVLNYNGWQDTIACVESVLASSEPPVWVIIVDNSSTNDSIRWLRHWAAGNLEFALSELGAPSSYPKPLALLDIVTEEAPNSFPGGVVLLRRSRNDGYAAGNNAGIRLLMRWGADAVWILNNDTIVDRDALGAMARRLFSKARPGLCGSLLRYTEGEKLVQCRAGGYLNKWTALSSLDGNMEDVAVALSIDPAIVEQRINYICGASVMASRAFIEQVGLMDESYFLYCEERDWACRANGRFDFAYAPDALVYHKEGGSTDFSHNKFKLRPILSLIRSRLLLTAKHNPIGLPIACFSIIYAALRMVWRRLVRRSAATKKAVATTSLER